MLFCPICHSQLQIQKGMKDMQFICQTCPYYFPVISRITRKMEFTSGLIDDIFGEDTNDTPTTEVNCEKCGNDKAFFKQMQTRSADEPTTIFYRCTNNSCQHSWKDN